VVELGALRADRPPAVQNVQCVQNSPGKSTFEFERSEPSFITALLRARIIRATAQNRVPAMHRHRFFVAEGGLISYGTDIAQCFAQAASYIDRILNVPANVLALAGEVI
jgi:hypothetical protein